MARFQYPAGHACYGAPLHTHPSATATLACLRDAKHIGAGNRAFAERHGVAECPLQKDWLPCHYPNCEYGGCDYAK